MSKGYRSPRYGRLLEEFEIGAVFQHPWEVTVDTGMLALFAASFLDATPVFASARVARALGFRDRPVHPLALLNFGLSSSVHDVSEQAIAHLAYIDVRFPNACDAGDPLRACSTVLGVMRSSEGERGVVHVRTLLFAEGERIVCQFERKVLVKAGGRISERPSPPASTLPCAAETTATMPAEFGRPLDMPKNAPGFAGFFEDFAPGEVICHDIGRTVSESEHMQLTYMFRNTHPLHFEEPYAVSGFAKTRVVYGGLVFAWIAPLASRGTTGKVFWEGGFDKGAPPAGVVSGDTLYAASRVLRREDLTSDYGSVTLKLVGTKNVKPATLLERGADLFTDEQSKAGPDKLRDKVFEIERTVLMRKRP